MEYMKMIKWRHSYPETKRTYRWLGVGYAEEGDDCGPFVWRPPDLEKKEEETKANHESVSGSGLLSEKKKGTKIVISGLDTGHHQGRMCGVDGTYRLIVFAKRGFFDENQTLDAKQLDGGSGQKTTVEFRLRCPGSTLAPTHLTVLHRKQKCRVTSCWYIFFPLTNDNRPTPSCPSIGWKAIERSGNCYSGTPNRIRLNNRELCGIDILYILSISIFSTLVCQLLCYLITEMENLAQRAVSSRLSLIFSRWRRLVFLSFTLILATFKRCVFLFGSGQLSFTAQLLPCGRKFTGAGHNSKLLESKMLIRKWTRREADLWLLPYVYTARSVGRSPTGTRSTTCGSIRARDDLNVAFFSCSKALWHRVIAPQQKNCTSISLRA